MKKIDLKKIRISKLNKDQTRLIYGGTLDVNCNGKSDLDPDDCKPKKPSQNNQGCTS